MMETILSRAPKREKKNRNIPQRFQNISVVCWETLNRYHDAAHARVYRMFASPQGFGIRPRCLCRAPLDGGLLSSVIPHRTKGLVFSPLLTADDTVEGSLAGLKLRLVKILPPVRSRVELPALSHATRADSACSCDRTALYAFSAVYNRARKGYPWHRDFVMKYSHLFLLFRIFFTFLSPFFNTRAPITFQGYIYFSICSALG